MAPSLRMIGFRYGQPYPALKSATKAGCAAAIGNFDGVHLGHRALIQSMVDYCKMVQLPSIAILFDPHPAELVRRVEPLFLLSTPTQRAEMLYGLGVTEVVCIDFTRRLSLLKAEDFCKEILKKWLDVRALFVGVNFRLGFKRKGDREELRRIGQLLKFETFFVEEEAMAGSSISSSRIRNFVAKGQVDKVKPLLGRPFALQGIVVQGAKRGRKLGFATANLAVDSRLQLPPVGVYATRVRWEGVAYQAVTNIGYRPTFEKTRALVMEAHLLDFEADLYGATLNIEFLARIRDEKPFDDLSALKLAIHRDILAAREVFSSNEQEKG